MKKSFYLSSLLCLCLLLCSQMVKATGVTPRFTSTLRDTTVCTGVHVIYTSKVIDTPGTDSLNTFIWQVSANGGTSWTNITSLGFYSGATSDTLHITADTSLSGHLYRLIAKNDTSLLSDTSNAATLTVLAVPVVSHLSGPSVVCVGSSITLTDSLGGGIWTTSTDSVSVSAGIVDGLLAGSAIITYKVTNICGSDTARKLITVNPLSLAGNITGAAPVCAGSSLLLADTASGGVWSTSNTSIASVDGSGNVTGIGQGFDTVKYTVTNGFSCVSVASAVVRVDTTVTAGTFSGPTTACVGSSVNLSNTNIYGTGIWTVSNSNAAVSALGVVTGISGGIDTVNYTFTNACNSVSFSIAVTIDTVLSHGVISGLSTVCAGSFITLSETISGGAWISGTATIANVDGSGDVTGVSQGVATISYYLSNGCGASIATYTVTVYQPAAAITGNDSVGVGNTLALSDVTPGGVWSSTNHSIANISTSGVVTGVSTGVDTIIYTVTNVCGTTSSMLTLYVGVPASPGHIIGADTVCKGSTIALRDTLVAGGVWSSKIDSIATVNDTGLVSGLLAGTDTIYYSVTTGFGTSKTSYRIVVNTPPVINITPPSAIAIGSSYILSVTPTGGIWTVSNDSIAMLLTSVFYTNLVVISSGNDTANISGTDTVRYTATNNCGTTTNYFVITIPQIASGVSQVNNNNASLSIYPNPAHDNFTLNLQSTTTEPAHIVITNVVGQVVKEMTVSTNVKSTISLDEPAGIYLLSATTSTGTYTAKVNMVN